jgi:hypothetical protein
MMENFDKRHSEPDVTPEDSTEEGQRRDPEDRSTGKQPHEVRDKMLDKTLADSFPTSDPPSSIPDPEEDDSFAA